MPNGMRVAEINNHETVFLYDEIFIQEVYSSYGLKLNSGSCVLDIGANIGMFSLYAAQKFEKVRILCFEPAPHCLDRLRINLESLGDSVKIFPTALGDTVGEVEFSYYPGYSILSGMFADEEQDLAVLRAGAQTQYIKKYAVAPSGRELEILVGSKLNGRQKFLCPITTLSHIIASECIEHIDLAKIDVERAENAILQGILEEDWPKIDQLVIEVHDQGKREHEVMASMLKDRGYLTDIFVEPTMENSSIYVVVARR
ncbi:MAG: FkbM family methyltransferase [Glaciimonas sp.]|nr:FkbM family methyltransferase [Glaciimonas sp.]